MKAEKQLNFLARYELLVGHSNIEKLKRKSVLVLGVGGVGGYVVEALARSGIGTLVIVDNDIVDITNINRQIIALHSTIGRKKVEVLKARIKDINPNCNVIIDDSFIDENNISSLFKNKIDYLVDACDTVSTKKCVLKYCIDKNIPSISCMGTAKKTDPSKLEIVDIRKTSYDPLARIMRKFVKDMKINKKVMVLSSTEIPKESSGKTLASSPFVPSSAGIMIASYVVNKLLDEK